MLGRIYMREPGSCIHEARGEQLNVETQMTRLHIDRFFFWREQIKEQRAETSVAEHACDVLITRAETTAATAVRKDDNAAGACRNLQNTVEHSLTRGNLYVTLPDIVCCMRCTHGHDLLPKAACT